MSDDTFVPGGDTGTGGGSMPPSGSSSPTAVAEAHESSPAGESSQPAAPAPVPYDRFKEVNDRYAALKWAERYQPDTIQQQQAFFDWLERDPESAFRFVEDHLTRQGALRSRAAKPEGDGRPQPDVFVPETGQRFYSAEASERLMEWQAKQLESKLTQRLQPLEQAETVGRARAAAQQQYREAQQWPYFKEHEQEVFRAMQADRRLSLEGAYNRVVVPKIRQIERQEVLKELNQKREASTLNPGGGAPPERKAASKMSWGDLFRRELSKRKA